MSSVLSGTAQFQSNPVGDTALLVAGVRALESRSDASARLYHDPFAEKLAGERGMQLAAEYLKLKPDIYDSFACRVRMIDEWVLAAAADGIHQIVMPGSGMDTRAHRLALPRQTRVFELDFEAVLRYKRQVYEKELGAVPVCSLSYIEADLGAGDGWIERLTAAGYKKDAPSLWLLEGLLMYLKEGDALHLLDLVASLSCPGSCIVVHAMYQSARTTVTSKAVSALGAPWEYFTDTMAEQLQSRYGYQVFPVTWRDPATFVNANVGTDGVYLERMRKAPADCGSYYVLGKKAKK